MNREILFRGKRNNSGEWVYGDLSTYFMGDVRIGVEEDLDINTEYRVMPATVGQYTGLTDKNGEKIFEGDIVKVKQEKETGDSFVYFENGAFVAVPRRGNIYQRTLWEYWYNDWDVEVIGNIHDNPELLQEDPNAHP